MKIKDLKKIEEFDCIIIDSLNKYMNLYSKTHLNFHSKKYTSKIYINENINIIFGTKSEKHKFENIKNEFSYDNNKIKHLLKYLYVFFATHRLSRKFFSTGKITYSQKCSFVDRCLIIPGRNKIRFQLDDASLFVGRKPNASRSGMDREIFARNYHTNINAPRIIEVMTSVGFREIAVSGKPINRAPADIQYKKKKEVINLLTHSSLWTKKKKVSIHHLFKRISRVLYKASPKLASDYHTIYRANIRPFQALTINLTMTHGDLQCANILSLGEEINIIDWENYGLRTEFYDIFTLLSDVRQSKHIVKSMYEFLNNNSHEDYLKLGLPLQVILFVWWSDEILFYLEEVKDISQNLKIHSLNKVSELLSDGTFCFSV